MSINFNTLAPISATVLSIGGLIFQIGRHSEKLDLLNNKVFAQENTIIKNKDSINDIKIFMSRTEEKLDDMNNNIKDIKNKLEKIEDRIHK